MLLENYVTKLITHVFGLTKRMTFEKCIHKEPVYTSLSKVPNIVSHNIPDDKLVRYGLDRGNTHRWRTG